MGPEVRVVHGVAIDEVGLSPEEVFGGELEVHIRVKGTAPFFELDEDIALFAPGKRPEAPDPPDAGAPDPLPVFCQRTRDAVSMPYLLSAHQDNALPPVSCRGQTTRDRSSAGNGLSAKRLPFTAPPPSYSPPGRAGYSRPRRSLPPASGRPLFPCCRPCTSRAQPSCAQTLPGQAHRGEARTSPAASLFSGSRSRGTSPRSAEPTTSAGGRRRGLVLLRREGDVVAGVDPGTRLHFYTRLHSFALDFTLQQTLCCRPSRRGRRTTSPPSRSPLPGR